jgi:hypothetical protein
MLDAKALSSMHAGEPQGTVTTYRSGGIVCALALRVPQAPWYVRARNEGHLAYFLHG